MQVGRSQGELGAQLRRTGSWVGRVERGEIHLKVSDLFRFEESLNIPRGTVMRLCQCAMEDDG